MTTLTTDDLFLALGRLYAENLALRRDLGIVRAMIEDDPDPPPDAPASMPAPEAPSSDGEGASALQEAA